MLQSIIKTRFKKIWSLGNIKIRQGQEHVKLETLDLNSTLMPIVIRTAQIIKLECALECIHYLIMSARKVLLQENYYINYVVSDKEVITYYYIFNAVVLNIF